MSKYHYDVMYQTCKNKKNVINMICLPLRQSDILSFAPDIYGPDKVLAKVLKILVLNFKKFKLKEIL